MPSESQFRDWVQQGREQYEATTQAREDGVSKSPQIDKGLADDAAAIGLSKLALGEGDHAREWLQRAADHYETALEKSVATAEDDPSSALVPWSWLLVCSAYLLGDERVYTVLDRVTDVPPRYPKLYPEHAVRLYQLLAFRSLLRYDEHDAREHLADVRRYAEARGEDDSFATAAEGLLDDDPETIAAGIEGMCEHHYDWIESDPDDRALGEGITMNALVMLTLALDRGYDLDVDHEGLLAPPPWKPTT